ncbi:MAG: hypothetical protein K2N74_05870, partial [Clostridiales bacterium]|nr:hypothetical protein [Clostridiales bacterium]
YDTFIFNQYFDTHIAGSSVATEDTLAVIEMIAKLSNSISLKDEAAVEAARRAFDALPNLEQQALVTNYTKLTNAEKTIAYLKANEPTTDTPVTPGVEEGGSVNALGIAGFTIAGVLLLALAAFAVYFFLGKKKAKASAGYFESTKTVNEESESTETTDADEAEEASETDDASEEDKADDNDDE